MVFLMNFPFLKHNGKKAVIFLAFASQYHAAGLPIKPVAKHHFRAILLTDIHKAQVPAVIFLGSNICWLVKKYNPVILVKDQIFGLRTLHFQCISCSIFLSSSLPEMFFATILPSRSNKKVEGTLEITYVCGPADS